MSEGKKKERPGKPGRSVLCEQKGGPVFLLRTGSLFMHEAYQTKSFLVCSEIVEVSDFGVLSRAGFAFPLSDSAATAVFVNAAQQI